MLGTFWSVSLENLPKCFCQLFFFGSAVFGLSVEKSRKTVTYFGSSDLEGCPSCGRELRGPASPSGFLNLTVAHPVSGGVAPAESKIELKSSLARSQSQVSPVVKWAGLTVAYQTHPVGLRWAPSPLVAPRSPPPQYDVWPEGKARSPRLLSGRG